MSEEKAGKPAKHTKQSFYDQQAISTVCAWIAETQRAMPDLNVLIYAFNRHLDEKIT